MTGEARIIWLRERIEARRDMAQAATRDGGGTRWHLDEDGCCVLDEDDDIAAEHNRSWAVMPHIAANDPQQVIADCEAQLGILGEFEMARRNFGRDTMAERCVAHVASAYWHQSGYQEHWGAQDNATF